jgi:hypothetical protein
MTHPALSAAVVGLALGAASFAMPAAALTMKECSTKYQAAKQAGTLGGKNWNTFRQAECGSAPDAATSTVPNPLAPTGTKPTAAAPAPSPAPAATAAKPATIPSAAGPIAYPAAIDPRYAKESAGKARMHTCLDSYNAAKAAGTLGDAKWIQKGGGYYSACNKRLKG